MLANIVSFESASNVHNSPLFLTKLASLKKENTRLEKELTTYDQAIDLLDREFIVLQQEAIESRKLVHEQVTEGLKSFE